MNIITYNKNGINLDIRFSIENKTIWMSQSDMATLYSSGLTSINNMLTKMPLNESSIHKIWRVAKDGRKREISHYDLDIIRRVGYKIDPLFTDEFIYWVKEELNRLNDEIIPIESNYIRYDNGEVTLDVNVEPKENTVWLTQNQMAELFDTTQQNISQHIANIICENELEEQSVHKESLYTALDGKEYTVSWYNLDMILAVGYRTKTKRAIEFRRWATKVLKTRKKENK